MSILAVPCCTYILTRYNTLLYTILQGLTRIWAKKHTTNEQMHLEAQEAMYLKVGILRNHLIAGTSPKFVLPDWFEKMYEKHSFIKYKNYRGGQN